MKETCNAKSMMKRGVSTKKKMTEEEEDEAHNNLHLVLSILMIGSLRTFFECNLITPVAIDIHKAGLYSDLRRRLNKCVKRVPRADQSDHGSEQHQNVNRRTQVPYLQSVNHFSGIGKGPPTVKSSHGNLRISARHPVTTFAWGP